MKSRKVNWENKRLHNNFTRFRGRRNESVRKTRPPYSGEGSFPRLLRVTNNCQESCVVAKRRNYWEKETV